MALWQFIVIVALFGAVFICANILTRRIGRANAALQRIEDALLARDALITPAATEATETQEAPEAPEAAAPPSEVFVEYTDAPRYLTIRDLKVRSELQRQSATRSEGHDAPKAGGDVPISKLRGLFAFGTRGEDRAPVASGPGNGEAVHSSDELPSEPATCVENEIPVASSLEGDDVLNTGDRLPSAPATSPVHERSDAQKEKDVLFFLSNQRRRRRARQGF